MNSRVVFLILFLIVAALDAVAQSLPVSRTPDGDYIIKMITPAENKVGPLKDGKRIAVLIGVSEYKSGADGFRALPLIANDIQRMENVLREVGYGEIHTFRDEGIDREKIRSFIEGTLPKLVDDKTQLLFYWAGHGSQMDSSAGAKGYFVLPHSIRGRVEDMLSMDQFYDWTRSASAKAQHTVFLVDTCFSGLFGGVHVSQVTGSGSNPAKYSSRVEIVYSSGASDEETFIGEQWGGSIFTKYLTDAIKARQKADSNSGEFSIMDVIPVVENSIRSERQYNQKIGVPTLKKFLGDKGGEFFFLRPHRVKIWDPDPLHNTGLSEAERDLIFGADVIVYYDHGNQSKARQVHTEIRALGAKDCGFKYMKSETDKIKGNVVYYKGKSRYQADLASAIAKYTSRFGIAAVGVAETGWLNDGVPLTCDIAIYVR